MIDVEDLILRRQIRVTRFGKKNQKEYLAAIAEVDDKYLMRIKKILDTMTGRDKRAFQQNKKTKRTVALNRLLDEWARDYKNVLKSALSSSYDDTYDAERKGMTTGRETVDVDKPPRLILGSTSIALAAASAQRLRQRVGATIKQDMGDGIDPYLGIAGTAALSYKDGMVWSRDNASLSAVMTATLEGGDEGRLTAMKANGVKKYRWLSTLDGKVCLICAERDGQPWGEKKGQPNPPAHYNCRCVLVPDILYKDPNYKRGAVTGDSLKNARDNAYRGGKITQVPAKTTFPNWLKTQPKWFQEEFLGPSRYQAYKKGEFTLSQFVDPRTSKIYTLDDLNIDLARREYER